MIVGYLVVGVVTGLACSVGAGLAGMGLGAAILAYPLGGLAGTTAAALAAAGRRMLPPSSEAGVPGTGGPEADQMG